MCEDFEVVKYLLDNGADPNLTGNYLAKIIFPLHAAVRVQNLEIIDLLIAHKARINILDSEGETPILGYLLITLNQ